MTEHPQTLDNPHETPPNGDQPNSQGGWLKCLVGIVVSPRQSFEIIRRNSPWLPGLLLMLLGAIVFAELIQPYQLQASRAELAAALPGGAEQADELMAQLEETVQASQVVRWTARAFAGATFAFALLIQTMFVWLLVLAFGGQARFVQTLSLMIHLGVIVHVQRWIALLIASVRGMDAIQSAKDAQPIPGLHLLLGGDNAALTVVWASINPFTIWFLALLGLGAAAVHGLPRRKGYLLAGVYWAATTALAAATTSVLAGLTPR